MQYVINVFIFRSYLPSIKNKDEGKNGRESSDEITKQLFKSFIDGKIEFKFR